MTKTGLKTVFIFWLGLAFFYSQSSLIFGQEEYVSAARNFLQAVRNGLGQAQAICRDIDCNPGSLDQLAALSDAADGLSVLLNANPPDVSSIRAAIDDMGWLVQGLCEQFGSCIELPSGAEDDGPAQEPVRPGPMRCRDQYQRCLNTFQQQQAACIQGVNKLLNCWRRVPYCNWSGFPFDPVAFRQDCQGFVDSGILPACRCDCDPGERQGGCPQFFQSGVECTDCSYSRCQRGGDDRCSCSQDGDKMGSWNSVQCDVCRWSSVGFALADLRRSLLCEKRYSERVERCWEILLDCYP